MNEQSNGKSEEQPKIQTSDEAWAGRTVLIVDDDPGTLKLLKGVLAKSGYDVIEATNGQEGLTQTLASKPHLIITDILMPGMDGLSFFTELKKDPEVAKIPVMILTVIDNMEEPYLSVGADAYMSKPIETQKFLSKVNELTGWTNIQYE